MPTARSQSASALLNNKIYVIGGGEPVDPIGFTVEVYTPSSNTWTTGVSLPHQRYAHSAVAFENKIYVIGGSDYTYMLPDVLTFDTITNTWATVTQLPTPRQALTSVVVGGTIYVIGGLLESGLRTGIVEAYDHLADTWTTKTAMPTARCGTGSCVINDEIYVFGGEGCPGGAYNIVEKYDPSTDSWTSFSTMPATRRACSVTTHNNIAYIFGGYSDCSTTIASNNTWAFNPCPEVSIIISASANPVPLGIPVTYSALVTNGGTSPVFQWQVNGINTGTNDDTLIYIPSHGDQITCQVTSSLSCATNNPATSNVITMIVITPCPGIPAVNYEGQMYNTVQIGCQCWLKENLNVGTMISGSQPQSDNATIEKYCYGDNTANCDTYGGLYQWNEVMQYTNVEGTQGICPPGWHIPTDNEWKVLEGTVDSIYSVCDTIWDAYGYRGYDAGKRVKSTTGWYDNGNGTNTSGFTALPGGYNINGYFDLLTKVGYFWSSTEISSEKAWERIYEWFHDDSFRGNFNKQWSRSVRCLYGDVNHKPDAPQNPSPPNSSAGQPLNIILSWDCYDPDNNTLTFDVLLGPPGNLAPIATVISDTFFNVSNLQNCTAYDWQIVAHDNHCNCTTGPVWSFTTIGNDTVSVSITASVNPVCEGMAVAFIASPINGGTNPSFQWIVNGFNMGSNSSSYTYVPANNDVVSCVLTSNASCATGSPAMSNQITMWVHSSTPPTITPPGPLALCPGDTVTLSVELQTGASYCWYEITTPNAWQNVGNPGFSAGQVNYTCLAFNPSGQPYVAFKDFGYSNQATVMKFDGINWVNVGNPGFSQGEVDYPSLAFSLTGQPYIAFRDNANSQKATVMKFDGINWVNVGIPGFSIWQAWHTSLAFSPENHPYVAFSDYGNWAKATVMQFDGTNWINVGTAGFSAGQAGCTSLAFSPEGQPYVGYSDIGNSGKATVMKYDGIDWINVGTPGLSSGQVDYTCLVFGPEGQPYLAYKDNGNSGHATVMKFDGSNWVNIGPYGFSLGEIEQISLAFSPSGQPFVAFPDGGYAYKAMVMKFEGTGWVNVGIAGFSTGTVAYLSLSFNPSGIPHVAFIDGGNGMKATVMDYSLPCAGNAPTFDVTMEGTYAMNLIDSAGCQVSSSNQVTVFTVTAPNPTITGPDTVCTGSSGTFTTEPGMTNYQWTLTGNPIINGGGSPTENTITLTWITMGSYQICVNYTDINGCTSADSTVYPVSVIQSDTVSIVIIASANPVCEGTQVTFTANPVNGGDLPSYQWKVNSNNVGTNSLSYTYTPANGDIITCLLTSSESCISNNPASSNPVSMTVNPIPDVSLSLCTPITSRDAKPYLLRGGIPLGGTYSGTGVQGGIFRPAQVPIGQTSVNVTYSYINAYTCVDFATQLLEVFPVSNHTCGDTFTDVRDNRTYATILLGNTCWMTENLNYGTHISTSAHQMDNCQPEKYCFNEATANCTNFGGLYQWDELMDYQEADTVQGLCPPGWHTPSVAEWQELIALFQDAAHAATSLKETGTSGFNALLMGFFVSPQTYKYGVADTTLNSALFWTSTISGQEKAWAHGMNEVLAEPTYTTSVSSYSSSRINAFSVRCVKDD
ncbi:MAG: hypothetical protein D4R67_05220 [Bacteroidetes bacterium]|nr:MAG: hypothetical protein D4R67_05220 [Bacteroidota bacterium]